MDITIFFISVNNIYYVQWSKGLSPGVVIVPLSLTSFTTALENKISDMKQATVNEYKKVMEGVELESCEPDMHIVKQEIQHCHRQVREMEKDFKKLENEKKILEFHKYACIQGQLCISLYLCIQETSKAAEETSRCAF